MSQSAAAQGPSPVSSSRVGAPGVGGVTDRPRRARISRHALGPMLMIAGILVVGAGALTFWLHGGRYVTVDDAYVRAAKEALSTDVAGIVAEVPVKDGQHVEQGQVLLRLDPRRYDIGVAGAKADLAETTLSLRAMQRDYRRMLRDIDVKQAQVQADQANYDRYATLVKGGGVTRAEFDNARFALSADQHAVESLKEQAEVQLARLGGAADTPVEQLPQYAAAMAKVHEAQRQLDNSVIRAPFAGTVTDVESVQPGMYLAASTAAFGLVSSERVWVEANPKETELTWVKPGDHVDVTVDTYPGRVWPGVVESISPNSGSEFSVLPAQNTSGNWVKVVQRIPVRIRVDRHPGDPELRTGMSVETSIDTGHTRSIADLF
ncbi:MAG TPA: HlyD family secretion protein [Acetobacteraceae bacterium]|nr:HlyD family secretion protein [Acetobacteraceae bacterium]